MNHAARVLAHLTSPATIASTYGTVAAAERTLDVLAGYSGWMPFRDREMTLSLDPLWPIRSELRERVRVECWAQRDRPAVWRVERIAALRREHTRLIGVDRIAAMAVVL